MCFFIVLFNLSAKIVTIYAPFCGQSLIFGFAPCKKLDISQLWVATATMVGVASGLLTAQIWISLLQVYTCLCLSVLYILRLPYRVLNVYVCACKSLFLACGGREPDSDQTISIKYLL